MTTSEPTAIENGCNSQKKPKMVASEPFEPKKRVCERCGESFFGVSPVCHMCYIELRQGEDDFFYGGEYGG